MTSRFPIVKDVEGSPKLQALYEDILANGFGENVPISWFTAQSTRPDLLETTWGLCKGILVQGNLPMTLKQMILTVISKQNNCAYCTSLHSGVLQGLGVEEKVIQACLTNIESEDIPSAQRRVLSFAARAAKDPNNLTDEDFRDLEENGLSNEDVMEVCFLASFTNFINTWADCAGISPGE